MAANSISGMASTYLIMPLNWLTTMSAITPCTLTQQQTGHAEYDQLEGACEWWLPWNKSTRTPTFLEKTGGIVMDYRP